MSVCSDTAGARRGARLLVAASMVLALGAACGGSTTHTASTTVATTAVPASTTTTSSVPAGYSGFTDAKDLFSIAVPTSWRQVDPNSPGAAQALQDIVAANPDLKSAFGGGTATLASAGTKFLAIDVSTHTGFAPNINVIAKPALGLTDADLPDVLAGLKSGLQSLGGVVTSSATVPISGHQVLQVHAHFPLTKPSGAKITVTETQDLIAANDFIYIVTFAGTSPSFTTIESTFSLASP